MYKCCLCGGKFEGMGNNPRPLNRRSGAKCCDKCNETIIIPMRIMEYLSAKRSKEA